MGITAEEFVIRMRSWRDYPFAHQSEAVRKATEMVFASVGKNFERAEDDRGQPWAPHSPVTIAIHGPHPLLILTGEMKKMAEGGAGSKRIKDFQKTHTVMKLTLSRAGKKKYWMKHQFGSEGPPRIPQRKFFFLHRQDRPAIVDFMRATIIKKIKKDLKWR